MANTVLNIKNIVIGDINHNTGNIENYETYGIYFHGLIPYSNFVHKRSNYKNYMKFVDNVKNSELFKLSVENNKLNIEINTIPDPYIPYYQTGGADAAMEVADDAMEVADKFGDLSRFKLTEPIILLKKEFYKYTLIDESEKSKEEYYDGLISKLIPINMLETKPQYVQQVKDMIKYYYEINIELSDEQIHVLVDKMTFKTTTIDDTFNTSLKKELLRLNLFSPTIARMIAEYTDKKVTIYYKKWLINNIDDIVDNLLECLPKLNERFGHFNCCFHIPTIIKNLNPDLKEKLLNFLKENLPHELDLAELVKLNDDDWKNEISLDLVAWHYNNGHEEGEAEPEAGGERAEPEAAAEAAAEPEAAAAEAGGERKKIRNLWDLFDMGNTMSYDKYVWFLLNFIFIMYKLNKKLGDNINIIPYVHFASIQFPLHLRFRLEYKDVNRESLFRYKQLKLAENYWDINLYEIIFNNIFRILYVLRKI